MATTIDVIRDRIASICGGAPFQFTEAVTPFDFELQPSGAIDGAFRVTSAQGSVIGGFNYSEERTDHVDVWVARKQAGAAGVCYRQLLLDASSLRAAVVRDGLVNGGDYAVPDDGAEYAIEHESGREYAVLRLTVPVNFEATV